MKIIDSEQLVTHERDAAQGVGHGRSRLAPTSIFVSSITSPMTL
jgi:hypothetical protein